MTTVGSGADVLVAWAERNRRREAEPGDEGVRFAFYGRVSTEDWQDPVTIPAAREMARHWGITVSESESPGTNMPATTGELVLGRDDRACRQLAQAPSRSGRASA